MAGSLLYALCFYIGVDSQEIAQDFTLAKAFAASSRLSNLPTVILFPFSRNRTFHLPLNILRGKRHKHLEVKPVELARSNTSGVKNITWDNYFTLSYHFPVQFPSKIHQ